MSNGVPGIVNHILPSSFVDGPGNRAVVFMQGCNFHCLYCHNPYTINFCDACGVCVDACPQNALQIVNGKIAWDASLCVECDACIKACPNFSSPRTRAYTPDELWQAIAPIQPFITGISISGGEPSLQIPFLVEFFRLVKQRSSLTTLIETNGYAGPKVYEPLLPYLDMAVVDMKSIQASQHEELTGKPLESVKKSISFLAEKKKLYAVHQVIVPEFTENEEQMRETAGFLVQIDAHTRLKLLRFRPHGVSGSAAHWPSPTEENMNALVETAKASGLVNVERSL